MEKDKEENRTKVWMKKIVVVALCAIVIATCSTIFVVPTIISMEILAHWHLLHHLLTIRLHCSNCQRCKNKDFGTRCYSYLFKYHLYLFFIKNVDKRTLSRHTCRQMYMMSMSAFKTFFVM